MNTSHRLNSLASDLVALGKTIRADERRAIAIGVAKWACLKSNLVSYVGEDRLRHLLREGAARTEQDRVRLQDDVDALDARYFEIQSGDDEATDVSKGLEWFSKARAAAAVAYLIDAGSEEGFCNVIYEAYAATDDLDGLRCICRSRV